MIYFAVRVLVYTLAAYAVVNVVPGLRPPPVPFVPQPYAMLAAFLALGVAFGAMQAVGRPLLLFFGGRLYIWSLGLLSVAAIAVFFLVVAYLSPERLEVPGGEVFSGVMGGFMMGLVVTLLEALTGLDAPRQDTAERTTPRYWRWLSLFPGRRRNRAVEGLRTVQLIGVARAYAVEMAVSYTPLAPVRRFMKRLLYRLRPRLDEDDPAVTLRLMLQDLGPTFVKFGQLVASRVEVLPARWREQLELLQDQVRAFPFAEAQRVVETELGAALETLFLTIDPEPLASASMGQVHAAALLDGTPVVVKVQRPNIAVVVKADLNILRDLLLTLEGRFRAFRRLGLLPLFDEFTDSLIDELDYETEAYQARMLRHNMLEFDFVEVPAVFPAYSTRRVLTMQRVSGVKITDVAALDEAGVDRRALALDLFRVLIQQVLFDGFFHADLHAGNVWYDLHARKLAFLDMGSVGQLSRSDRLRLAQLIWALHDRAAAPAAQVVLSLCEPPEAPVEMPKLRRDVERLINRHLLLDAEAAGISELFAELVTLLVRHGLLLRPEFTLAFKAIGQGEAIMRTLMGDEQPGAIVDIAFRTIRQALVRELDPRRLGPDTLLPLTREALGRLPNLVSALTSLLDDFERGRTALQLDVSSVNRRVTDVQDSFERGFRRMVLSISLAGLLLGSSLLLLAPLGDIVSGNEEFVIRLVAGIGVTASGVMTISIVASMLLPLGREVARRERR
ncbi:MAG: hypothetical protein GX560_10105 [Deinococcales bacterium]|nr:hypothetical protein [Deinococcales bacterium]